MLLSLASLNERAKEAYNSGLANMVIEQSRTKETIPLAQSANEFLKATKSINGLTEFG